MYNVTIKLPSHLLPPIDAVLNLLLIQENLKKDEPFAFSAIMRGNTIKINCLDEKLKNPFTAEQLIEQLYHNSNSNNQVTTVMPPLELYLTVFRPNLHALVNKAYSFYNKLIPEKEELMCILNYCIVKLYNKGYYLHNQLIYRTFTNQLNENIRKTKNFQNMLSLDAEIGHEDDGSTLSLADQLECPQSTLEAYGQFHYTEQDYRDDLFEMLKETMLKDMSELQFERILIQIKTKTIDTPCSRILTKYRKMFNLEQEPSRRPRK